ncbi:MAG: GTP cyclohydrolase I FolE2 [Deltaproteobacteria bacterium]|nr:MAG: GTP cyclohydrolase I FolE2 [Deltaproteobacteria bacterium]
MKDVQKENDYRNIPIDKVGIKNLRYPVTVQDRENKYQETVANIDMFVNLPHHVKGTHMSRFVEMLHIFRQELSFNAFSKILEEMKIHLDAKSSHIEIRFPYFIRKKAPVTGVAGLMDYSCRITGESYEDGRIDIFSEVEVPVTSVCPCSKEISEFGAHNQRGIVRICVRFKKFIWMEDLIKIAEKSASCEVYSVLKRADEKNVTEMGFNNPKFVEDIARDAAKELYEDKNILWFEVSVENFESIHNHSAYAYISSEGIEASRKGNL